MKSGDIGAQVGDLQRRLYTNGYKVEETNVYDERTVAVVRQLQARAGLVDDGKFGPKTDAYLRGSETGHLLKQRDLVNAANRLGVDLPSVMAVNEVESTGSGFIEPGVPKILFERHVFWQRLRARGIDPAPLAQKYPGTVNQKRGGYAGGRSEYTRLHVALQINRDAAWESASWGAFQIMGYHWETLGFDSVQAFVEAMRSGEAAQLDSFAAFILADPNLHRALKGRKWSTFARIYNGPAYAENLYDVKLSRAYSRFADMLQAAA
ncbi:DUF3380 domain-containing protein [Alcaligenaceae bacterium SJ-26]|nr:DUF3380 domain-containing protein [Alcaligenaceae bacterium SJ-26]